MINLEYLKSEKEKVEKGCGESQGRGLNYYICGDILIERLCPTCQAKLEALNLGIQAVENTIKDKLINNCCEQEFLSYIYGYFKSNAPADSHIRLLVKERLDNTIKEYKELQKQTGETK